ncbi:MAG: FAD binding domain-containing protein [Dehalococcoidia bacterium]
MARFEYLEARSLRQAVSLLQRYGEDARLVAGSTDFLVRWRTGTWSPKYVINLQHISRLSRIGYSSRSGLRLGALVTIQELSDHPQIRRNYPALATAAASFAGVQIRNLATVGGNVCNASPAGDTLPGLLVFDAQCRVVGTQGERSIPLDQFFVGPGRTALQAGEILTEIQLPPTVANTGSIYIKHSPRGAMDIAMVGVALLVTLGEGGRVCRDARIALGAVAATPLRAYAAEEMLKGQTITPELLDSVSAEAQRAATPIDDVRGSASYRHAIVGALTRRTLERAVQMAGPVSVPYEEQRRWAVQTAF